MASIGSSTQSQNDVGNYAAAFGVSLGIASLFNAFLFVLKETNPDTVLAWMKMNGAANHWVTQSILDLVIFVALGLVTGAEPRAVKFVRCAV